MSISSLRAMSVKRSRMEPQCDTDAHNAEVAAVSVEIYRELAAEAKSQGWSLKDVAVLRLCRLEACYRSTVAMVALLRDELEAVRQEQAQFRYVGTWKSGESYRRGNFCTDEGSLWTCLCDTSERPGRSDKWRLAVKRGRDGKDA